MHRKLVYVGFSFLHHKGTHAGYHHIKDYVKYDYVIDCQEYYDKSLSLSSSLLLRIIQRILKKLCGVITVPWYLLSIIRLGIMHNNLVFHYIYGENIFFPFVKKIIRRGNLSVCTLHQPFSFFQTKRGKSIISKSDYLILVGNTEVELFESITGRKNIYYIPHGVSTDFYCINESVKKEKMILTVGNWLRDYRFANDIYTKLLKSDPELEIHIVTNHENQAELSKNLQIHFYSGISDSELLSLYQRCSVLFLPLIRYTANNALLEAAACGCNIVISSNHPDNGYIPSDMITIVGMDTVDTITAISQAMSYSTNKYLSEYIVRKYDWRIIGNETKAVLTNL